MYTIKRTDRKITSIWDENWQKAELADVNICQWEDRKSDIHMTAKIMYDDNRIYVRMETDEKMPIATQTEQNSMVCNDSCMEFFISPNEEDKRYINFEFNPYGTMYVSVRKSRHEWVFTDEDRDYFEVQSHVDDKRWVIQFVIPYEYIDKIFGGHTKNMKGNFYKCGQKDGKRHNLTYYLVDLEQPDFHTPQFFGEFVLE